MSYWHKIWVLPGSSNSKAHCPGGECKVFWQRQFLPFIPGKNLWACFSNLGVYHRFSVTQMADFCARGGAQDLLGMKHSLVAFWEWHHSGLKLPCLFCSWWKGTWSWGLKCMWKGLVLRFAVKSGRAGGVKLLWDCQIRILNVRSTPLVF